MGLSTVATRIARHEANQLLSTPDLAPMAFTAGDLQGDQPLAALDPAQGMLVEPAALRAALEAGARLVYLEAPVRLTGASYPAATLQAIAELAVEYEAGLIIDQGLAPWSDAPVAGAILASTGMTRTALLGELLPGLGLQSWQIGYLVADEAWLPAIQSLKQVMAICTSTASQFAALEAMEHSAGAWASLRQGLAQRLCQY
ncbi:MAG: aminotransferase class I/II-fold pyridoxal phosphate-dependent enzyme [Oscillochloridaceae bacterium umkhey_bin13]